VMVLEWEGFEVCALPNVVEANTFNVVPVLATTWSKKRPVIVWAEKPGRRLVDM
jgi:hypothetical protein